MAGSFAGKPGLMAAGKLFAASGMVALMAAEATAAPFVVSSPDAADTVELKVDVDYRDRTGREVLVLPKMELTIPVANRLDLSITLQHRVVEGSGERTRRGLGDTSVSMKMYLLSPEESPLGVGFGIEPEISIPTGKASAGLGAGKAGFSIPLIVSKPMGPFELGAEFGYSHFFGAQDDNVSFAILGLYQAVPHLRLGLEIASQTPGLSIRERSTGINAGFKWDLGADVQAYGLLGRSIERPLHEIEERLKIGMRVNL